MRIDKLLANEGFGSRKEVKQLLKQGGVLKNETVIKDAKTHIDPESDTITVFGEPVDYKPFVYFMLHKPGGVITATEDNREETVIDLLEPEDQLREPFPVGRLDKDTEGLLLITNDGKLAHQLLSPKKNVGKTYYAKINGKVSQTDVEVFQNGVRLDDGYITKPAELQVITSDTESEIYVTITEGKYHQIKRMFEAVDKSVLYLKRLAFGSWELDSTLDKGEYRELGDEEIDYLKQLTTKK
ncbi:ribosomal large subunit pseudouridine synthase B [Paraliobacillus ryukyuensis]|uniref:Pseudouridine synthase n=1 Tax=Paraliobacillus ryukyuensis TaxID=200904 RepID=A0A366EAJ5_9BACI|nr:pseudouridine synthase [Paraliobacillus ryukyuensis]RBO99337.1 ribosomal small subunit pseudouridine synthase A [Paraliobacillus ryukyuensis]